MEHCATGAYPDLCALSVREKELAMEPAMEGTVVEAWIVLLSTA